MPEQYKNICCIHSFDESTAFLSSFKSNFPDTYTAVQPNDESLFEIQARLKALEPKSLIIFLGHGYSRGIYSPRSDEYEKKIFIDVHSSNEYFVGHDIILLSCKSSDFIRSITHCNSAIGFGNIISSSEESSAEAEYTGHFRDLSDDDIQYFNGAYVNAVSTSIDLLIKGKLDFKKLPSIISFIINQEINKILKNKNKVNRKEVARLLYEFRNEISLKQS